MKNLMKRKQDTASDKVALVHHKSCCNTEYSLNKEGEVFPITTAKCPFWIEVARKSKVGFDYHCPERQQPSIPVSLYNYDYEPDQHQQQRDDNDSDEIVVPPYVINVWDVACSTIFLDEEDMGYLREGTRDVRSCFRWKERPVKQQQVVTQPNRLVRPPPLTVNTNTTNTNNNTCDRPYYLEPALGSSRKGTVVWGLPKGEVFGYDDDEDTTSPGSPEKSGNRDQKKLGPNQASF